MTSDSVQERPAAAGAAPRKRGRETAGDMLRSLAVILVLVVGMWYLAQPPDSDEAPIRVVDTATDIRAFRTAVPTVPAPAGLPAGWRPTSSTLGAAPDALRIGYVTPKDQYAEYAASAAPAEEFLPAITGKDAEQLAAVQVDGQTWQQYRSKDALSLVRSYGSVSVVIGSVRSTATMAELSALAGSLQR